MSNGYFLSCSIYVRCKNRQKFKSTHLPAIELLIGVPESGWEISEEPHNPNEIRAFAFINLKTSSKSDAAILSLKLMGQLYPGKWNISEFSSLNTNEPLEMFGSMYTNKPSPIAPALTTVQIEVHEAGILDLEPVGS